MLLELLDRRLAGLSASAWAIIRVLGVAARPLDAHQVASASGLGTEQLTKDLRDLRSRRLVRAAVNGSIELHHPLLSEAARDRFVPGEAADVHRAVAETLATDPDSSPAEVATHWQLAGEPTREITWRVAAARDSAASFDWAQEAEHWLRVLSLWPGQEPARVGDPPVTRANVYISAMDALSELQWDRAAAMSDAAPDQLSDIDDATRAALLHRASNYRGEREGVAVGMALIGEAMAIYDRLPPSTNHLRAMKEKWLLLIGAGRFEEAGALAMSATRAAAALGDPGMHRHHMTSLAWHRGVDGDVALAVRTLDDAHRLLPDASDPVGDVRQAVIATDVMLICGHDVGEIEAVGGAALEAAEARGMDSEAVLILRANVAYARIRAGQVSRAADLIGVGADESLDIDRWPVHYVRAVIDMLEGNARAGVERVDLLWREVGPVDQVDLESLCTVSDIHFWAGSPRHTLPRLLHDLDQVVDSAPIRMLAPALVAAARAAAEPPRVSGPDVAPPPASASVHALLSRACVGRRESDERDPHIAAHVTTAAVELARATGEDGIASWSGAATEWDRLTRPHDAAYCRWRAAQAALREGRATVARRLLERAAVDAREHVPLHRAISATVAGGR